MSELPKSIHIYADLDRLIQAAQLAEDIVGHPLPDSIKIGGSLDALREKAGAAA